MQLGIILVHGYTGSNHTFDPLVGALAGRFGANCITNLALPGHNDDQSPDFDAALFCDTIYQAINIYQKEQRQLILIGHSTGGNLILATLKRFSIKPALVILVATPPQIDRDYFARWEKHRAGKSPVSLVDVALMVKFINANGSQHFNPQYPVLIIQGENDQLVTATAATDWSANSSPQTTRLVMIPAAGHEVINGQNGNLASDLIQRSITDIATSDHTESPAIKALLQVEPGTVAFVAATPGSKHHLSSCPGVQRLLGVKPELSPIAPNEPVLANIEITTYCNLKCRFCARTQLNKGNQHMSLALFQNILALLPNLYKIVLVGLGEPLLHPQIIEFIHYAKALKKKVGLVTNAMLLDREVSQQLLAAGLDSIAFSLDGADLALSSEVRAGTDFTRVITNIREFVKLAKTTSPISKAVFSAVSINTVAYLPSLVDRVADLGVDVLMLTDINFKSNLKHTLWQNPSEAFETTVKNAISKAFSKNLPVLSVHGLEEFGLAERYHDFLMIPPGQLYQRSATHTWCYSPWQTIPINVAGEITLCDCQPTMIVGDLRQEAFSQIWNGETFQKHRAAMLSANPPDACKICPRF